MAANGRDGKPDTRKLTPVWWLALGLATLSSCGSPRRDAAPDAWRPPAPRNAVALVGSVGFNATQFIVENRGEVLWRDVVVDVYRSAAHSRYTSKADAVLGHRNLAIGALHFESESGARLSPFEGAPTVFAITARLPDGSLGFVTGEIREVAQER
jgi:hypothetical protein